MKRKPLRSCAVCHHPISEQRPVYLIVDSTLEIRGPLHAGCAERESIYARKKILLRDTGYTTWEEFGRIITVQAQTEESAPDQEASS